MAASPNVWAVKHKNINERPMTAMTPAWIKLNKKKQSFELIDSRVEVVKRIFDLYLKGNGVFRICTILNQDGIPVFEKSEKWCVSSIQAIFKNRAVLGEYQPHLSIRSEKGHERIPDREPIKDYYPRIISDETFYAVQTRLVEQWKGCKKGFT